MNKIQQMYLVLVLVWLGIIVSHAIMSRNTKRKSFKETQEQQQEHRLMLQNAKRHAAIIWVGYRFKRGV